jgi:hypothetical protein
MQVGEEEVKAAWLQEQSEVFLHTCAAWERVQPYESRIRRRWWHQNALQAPQLLAWWQYLDTVAATDDETALYALHERCLVPCASYPGALTALRWARAALCHPGRLTAAPAVQSSGAATLRSCTAPRRCRAPG